MTSSQIGLVQPLNIADARAAIRHVFVRDLVLDCSIGVHQYEREALQRIRINLDLAVREGDTNGNLGDDLANVVCYEELTKGVRDLISREHVNLVETLAEDVAAMCLEDNRVRSARVRIEKLDILKDAVSVGVEIERFNPES
jgi:7,8-dihydroneopterin aldolase/epimerase/oxygenase